MDITVYLPEAIGEQAKAASLPLSQLLRSAVQDELLRRERVASTLAGAQEHELDLEDRIGVLTGVVLGEGENKHGDIAYLTDDERVMVYEPGRLRVQELDDPERQLPDYFADDDLIAVMRDLGLTARVQL